MIDFVDIHCHALFRVDDGALDEQMMYNMLDMAYDNGTRTICFTPHFKIFEFDSDEEIYSHMNRLERRFKIANEYVIEKHPDMQLFLGNEIMYHSDICDSLLSKKCHFLGNSSYALIEFSPDTSAYDIRSTINKLLRQGIRPVVAHVERYTAFIKDYSLVSELKESGVLLQVNAKALTKFKIGRIAKFIKSLLNKKLVDVVASDAHNDSTFPPQLIKAYELVAKKYGGDYADKIFHHIPLAIITDKKMF